MPILLNNKFCFADFSLNPMNYCMYKNGEYLNIGTEPYKVLRFLLENRGEILSRKKILLDALNLNSEVETRRVDLYVSRVRKIIGDIDKSIIKTIHGIGYLFCNNI